MPLAMRCRALLTCVVRHYGAQAVVVSIDPKRVYVTDPTDATLKDKTVVRLRGAKGPSGEEYCWWQATVKGGREVRNIDAVQLAKVLFTILRCFSSVSSNVACRVGVRDIRGRRNNA